MLNLKNNFRKKIFLVLFVSFLLNNTSYACPAASKKSLRIPVGKIILRMSQAEKKLLKDNFAKALVSFDVKRVKEMLDLDPGQNLATQDNMDKIFNFMRNVSYEADKEQEYSWRPLEYRPSASNYFEKKLSKDSGFLIAYLQIIKLFLEKNPSIATGANLAVILPYLNTVVFKISLDPYHGKGEDLFVYESWWRFDYVEVRKHAYEVFEVFCKQNKRALSAENKKIVESVIANRRGKSIKGHEYIEKALQAFTDNAAVENIAAKCSI